MGRPGITREQVFETADAIANEGVTPTVMAVRTRLGGGSPNNITKWLSEWREQNETSKVDALPPLPEGVESAMRQVWGSAWKGAQVQLDAEREALSTARKEIEKERNEMLSEIGRLDAQLEGARAETRKTSEELETERRVHDKTRSEVREALTVAAEREKRIGSREADLREVRHQTTQAESKVSRLEADLSHTRNDLETARAEAGREADTRAELAKELDQARRELDGLTRDLQVATAAGEKAQADLQKVQAEAAELRQDQADLIAERDRAQADTERLSADLGSAKAQSKEAKTVIDASGKKVQNLEAAIETEREARAAAEKALAELRVEAATLTERAAHAEELRELLQELRKQTPASRTRRKKEADTPKE